MGFPRNCWEEPVNFSGFVSNKIFQKECKILGKRFITLNIPKICCYRFEEEQMASGWNGWIYSQFFTALCLCSTYLWVELKFGFQLNLTKIQTGRWLLLVNNRFLSNLGLGTFEVVYVYRILKIEIRDDYC